MLLAPQARSWSRTGPGPGPGARLFVVLLAAAAARPPGWPRAPGFSSLLIHHVFHFPAYAGAGLRRSPGGPHCSRPNDSISLYTSCSASSRPTLPRLASPRLAMTPGRLPAAPLTATTARALSRVSLYSRHRPPPAPHFHSHGQRHGAPYNLTKPRTHKPCNHQPSPNKPPTNSQKSRRGTHHSLPISIRPKQRRRTRACLFSTARAGGAGGRTRARAKRPMRKTTTTRAGAFLRPPPAQTRAHGHPAKRRVVFGKTRVWHAVSRTNERRGKDVPLQPSSLIRQNAKIYSPHLQPPNPSAPRPATRRGRVSATSAVARRLPTGRAELRRVATRCGKVQ